MAWEAQQPGLQDVTGSDADEHEADEEVDEFRDVHMTLGRALTDVREQHRETVKEEDRPRHRNRTTSAEPIRGCALCLGSMRRIRE